MFLSNKIYKKLNFIHKFLLNKKVWNQYKIEITLKIF